MKNLKEFKALKKRYESITLEEIEKKPFEKIWTAQRLTGHGDIHDCTLCVSAKSCASDCVYGETGCTSGINANTYHKISNANTPLELRNAYRARAKHMKTLIKS